MKKIVRITTIPGSMRSLLKGQLKFMNQYYEVIGISGDGDALEDVRKNEGIRTEVVEMTRTISPIKDIVALFKLYKILKNEQPHIVHTHTPKAGIIGMLAAKLAGVPHRFHTVAGMPLLVVNGPKRWLLNFIEKLTYSCATNVFPNSFGLQKIIIDQGFATKEKLKVIGNGSSNGINTDYFNPDLLNEQDLNLLKSELKISENQFVFIFIGRIVTDKGINELVVAFNKLSKNQDIKLILVGWQEEDLDPLIEETETILNQNRSIIQVGYQNDVRPYLAIADVLVFASYREGFPNVVMQAGAMKLPSIVTDINGCNEIITEGKNGVIIPVKNVQAIIDAMTYFLNNPSKLKSMGLKSREIIVRNYQHTYLWNELLKEYRNTE
jgi:glycosyltransferase involved in cell wall biosynthesis